MSRIGQFIEMKKRSMVASILGCEWGLAANEHERSLLGIENILQLNCDDCTIL